MELKIKKGFEEVEIGFNNSALPLSQRSQTDLKDLVILAHSSGRKDYLDLFEDVPTLAQLQTEKVDAALATVAPTPTPSPSLPPAPQGPTQAKMPDQKDQSGQGNKKP